MGEKRGSRGVVRTILVVDDDDSALAAHRRFGNRERVVITASTPIAAIEIAQAQLIDLAIVDLRIGRSAAMLESGIEVVRELKRVQPSMAVALVSGYLSVETAVSASRAGADLVKFKPVTIPELLHALQQGDPTPPLTVETPSLARAEWEHLQRVLADAKGNVSEAARRLRIFRTSLQRKLKKQAPRA
ncbi:MAG: response regulator [Deltaproteobacteria bacterium]|nr:response regulator [Deltaproteobacteria bacterium]MCW5805762.1 response regulator [Deltaproteobacteria bacterium]